MDWYLESRPLSSFSPDALWCTWFGDGTKLSAVHSNSNKNAIRLPSNHMFVIDIPRRNQRRRICAERYTLRHVIIRTIWTIRTVRAMNHGTIRNLRKRLSESFVGSWHWRRSECGVGRSSSIGSHAARHCKPCTGKEDKKDKKDKKSKKKKKKVTCPQHTAQGSVCVCASWCQQEKCRTDMVPCMLLCHSLPGFYCRSTFVFIWEHNNPT